MRIGPPPLTTDGSTAVIVTITIRILNRNLTLNLARPHGISGTVGTIGTTKTIYACILVVEFERPRCFRYSGRNDTSPPSHPESESEVATHCLFPLWQQ